MIAPEIRTQRLVLKALDLSFLSKTYVNWMNDLDINQYLESGGDYDMQKLREYLEQVESNPILFWAVTLLDSDKHIGNIKIDPINQKHLNGEYGILMGAKEEWGKGYATEASKAVIKYCFSDEVMLHKITLGVVSDNTAAVKLYEKLGFEVEGVLKKHARYDDKWHDILRMAIFNPEWHD